MGKRKKKQLTKTEPAMIRGFVVAVLGLLTTLGFTWADLDKATIGSIVAVLAFVLPMGQALWTRMAVRPVGSTPKVKVTVDPEQVRAVMDHYFDAEGRRRGPGLD